MGAKLSLPKEQNIYESISIEAGEDKYISAKIIPFGSRRVDVSMIACNPNVNILRKLNKNQRRSKYEYCQSKYLKLHSQRKHSTRSHLPRRLIYVNLRFTKKAAKNVLNLSLQSSASSVEHLSIECEADVEEDVSEITMRFEEEKPDRCLKAIGFEQDCLHCGRFENLPLDVGICVRCGNHPYPQRTFFNSPVCCAICHEQIQWFEERCIRCFSGICHDCISQGRSHFHDH